MIQSVFSFCFCKLSLYRVRIVIVKSAIAMSILRYMLVLTAALLLIAAVRGAALDGDELVDVFPERPLHAERLACGSTRLYRLRELDVARVYDVKISYPATIPTVFDLRVRRVVVTPDTVAGPRRRVLNTAKLRLHPRTLLRDERLVTSTAFALDPSVLDNPATNSQSSFVIELEVLAKVEGVSRVLDLANRECVYDLVVEEMLFEAAPWDAVVLVAWLLVALAVAKVKIFPFLLAKVALARPEDQIPAKKAPQPKDS